MILIFGGTTEGRKAVEVVDKAGKPFYYSTKGEGQEVRALHGVRLSGAMDREAMTACCREHDIRLLIDAAHPFAGQLHQTIADVSESLHLPVIRYERIYPKRDTAIVWCEDYADAITKLREADISRLLALTGVQTISKLKPFWETTETWFRILPREESLQMARRQGFPEERLLYYQAESDDAQLIRELAPDAVILKESGVSGGFTEKVDAARRNGVKVFAIKRPILSDEFYTVDGEHGLRRMIQELLPDFYALRTGITTGSCATAAAVAAIRALVTGKKQTHTVIRLPGGESISVPIADTQKEDEMAQCTVIKDAGDDADVTNGLPVVVRVSYLDEDNGLLLTAGDGVGIVTLPGLGLPVGTPAINTGPQQMIRQNVRDTLWSLGVDPDDEGFEIRISVPGGEEIARRTFNPRLGIAGGISIIGTSGIVQPFSVEAFVASIRKSMEVARASLTPRVVINSGAKSEKFLRRYYPDLPDVAFVHYGNNIGETLKIADELKIDNVTMGIMIGKAVKLADGHLNTHSKEITMNKPFLMLLATRAGCDDSVLEAIERLTLARELWDIIPENLYLPFFSTLLSLCYMHCTELLPDGELTILLVKEDGTIMENLP